MTGRDLFGALARFIGLLLTTYGIYNLLYEAVGTVVPSVPHRMPPATGAIFGVVYLLFGVVLLLGGGLIARLVYGQKSSN